MLLGFFFHHEHTLILLKEGRKGGREVGRKGGKKKRGRNWEREKERRRRGKKTDAEKEEERGEEDSANNQPTNRGLLATWLLQAQKMIFLKELQKPASQEKLTMCEGKSLPMSFSGEH